MKPFTLGMVAGAASLAVSVPLVAQFAFAATGDAATSSAGDRPVPSQACVQALATHDTTMLSTIDAHTAAHKAALQTKRDALTAAAAITDDAQRADAVKAAHEAFRAAMEKVMESHEEHREEMDAIRDACGDAFMFKGKHMMRGPGGHGPMGFKMMKFRHLKMDGEAPTLE